MRAPHQERRCWRRSAIITAQRKIKVLDFYPTPGDKIFEALSEKHGPVLDRDDDHATMDVVERVIEIPFLGQVVHIEVAVWRDIVRLHRRNVRPDDLCGGMFVGKIYCPDASSSPDVEDILEARGQGVQRRPVELGIECQVEQLMLEVQPVELLLIVW